MNGAEGIRIEAGAEANAAISLRTAPDVPHDLSGAMPIASNATGSDMPSWARILEALGLTSQNSAANIASLSRTLTPPGAGSAQASANSSRPALSNGKVAQEGGGSKGLDLNPGVLWEAPLGGTGAPSKSPPRAAALQAEVPHKGNAKKCGGGPAKDESLPGSEIAIVANVTVAVAVSVHPQAPPAEPGSSGTAPRITAPQAAGPEPALLSMPGESAIHGVCLPTPTSNEEAGPSMHDTASETRVEDQDLAPNVETQGNRTAVRALPKNISKADPSKAAIATPQLVQSAAVPAASPNLDASLPGSESAVNVSVRGTGRTSPLSGGRNFSPIQELPRRASGLNGSVNASSPGIQYPGIHTAEFDAPPLRESVGAAGNADASAVMPHSASPGTADTFAALDAQRTAPAPTWIHAGARHAEAGYLDPALGWVAVRADAAGSGFHAALLPASGEAAQVLGSHLAGLNAYLSQHHGESATVTMSAPENGRHASGMGAGTHPNQGDSARQDDTRGRKALADRQEPEVSGIWQRGSGAVSGPTGAYVAIGGGRYVSVIA